ncbi:hypothetical protein R9X47_27660 [Wukongibacter baidiensis]|uniref:hypothetical protein n=1 Tax=Wukongibacter baidiensis TaxID=1723361 RepID=UPI003D7FEE91
MKREIVNWLNDGPSWLQYAVQLQLINGKPDINLVMDGDKIVKIIDRIKDKQVGIPALKTGKVLYTKTGNAYWDLFFLADIGLTIDELNLEKEIDQILDLQRPDGTFVTQENIRPNYFCIPTILMSSIVKMGYKNDSRLDKYIEIILETQRLDGGWHCAKSRAKGQKLQDTESCPMDNLNILMLLSQYEEYRNDKRFEGAIDLLLNHWYRKDENWRPYGFGVGKDFKKLKYPAIKYGILRVLDVLSLFPYAIKSRGFNEMLEFVQQRADNGKYFAESVVKSYAEFDFGQKKEPSRWITFLVNRIEKRINECK